MMRSKSSDGAGCGACPRSAVLAGGFLALFLLVVPGGIARGDGTVTGHARFERVKGHPELGYHELYEWNIFLSPSASPPLGPSARLGAPAGQPARGDGYYSIDVPPGTWSILVNQPEFFARPRVISDVAIRDGVVTTQNVNLALDYSTYFTDTWTVWDSVWMQTFTATGNSVTGVSWKVAGTNASEIRASIHRDNGNPNPATWPQVSSKAAKADGSLSVGGDNWVRWRSGEVPTSPGETYAVKLTGVAGGNREFAVFQRPKDARSYSGGRSYSSGGAAQNFDLNITVFSDNDGTAVILSKTTAGIGSLEDGNFGGRWGQTFKAVDGSSLAGVDVWAAGAQTWDLDFQWSVFQDGPGGPQVGPTKQTKAAFFASGVGLHGVSFSRGEVPIIAGETYYVEFTNSPGFNPLIMSDSADAYPDGTSYQDGSARSFDLAMTVVVYTDPGGTVEGTVRDADAGTPLEGATVRIPDLSRSVLTGADGRYELREVPVGAYTVRAGKPGYEEDARAMVQVRAGEATTVDFSLVEEPCGIQFHNSGFEGGLDGWTRYGDARNSVVDTSGGGWFADIVAPEGTKFHGNEVNGCCMNGGLYQQACAEPGHRYRVTVLSNLYWISGDADDARSRVGIDPAGGTDPQAGSVAWGAWHRQPLEATEGWRQIAVVAEATGPVLTVFLDFAQAPASGNQWRINCFDLVTITDLDPVTEHEFRRGDCDRNAILELSDAVYQLGYLYQGQEAPGCDDACDSNDDGFADLSDAVYTLLYLYAGGSAPPPPGASCGNDPTGNDPLDCESASTGC